MVENTLKHKFVIDKWKRNGKITHLTIRRKARLHDPIFTVKINPPIPIIQFITPIWVREFVEKMNKGEIKIRVKSK